LLCRVLPFALLRLQIRFVFVSCFLTLDLHKMSVFSTRLSEAFRPQRLLTNDQLLQLEQQQLEQTASEGGARDTTCPASRL
jgi:hypothetical protein